MPSGKKNINSIRVQHWGEITENKGQKTSDFAKSTIQINGNRYFFIVFDSPQAQYTTL